MLYYGRIDLTEGIDVAKSNNGKECIICPYWYFNHGYFNHCNDLKVLCLNKSDIAIITVKAADYRCITQI